ncbi:MAG TPA: hypothetical protein PK681_08155 [Steroidobacteraceae bacterium]|nr:hypothetical protein [Steroidobacteraceae bacterium]
MVDDVQVFAFAAITAVSGYLMWRRNMRAANLMEGTATSRVASAAKGYVELAGTARGAGGQPVRDPIESLGCLWYNVVTETRNRWSRNRNWSVERRESSTEPLSLQDDTGSCLIVPGEAKIDEEQDPDAIVKESPTRRHKIWRIHDGDPLYALGFLERREPALEDAQVGLLRVWKRNQVNLLERFDGNRDGRIDAAEWERTRRAAAERAAADAAAAPDAHIRYQLRRPVDDRPLLIASRTEVEVSHRVIWRSRLGLAMFIGGTLYVLFALQRYLT